MKKIKKNIFLIVFLFTVFFSSCEIINPEETVPSYLRIDTIKLDVASNLGSNSHKITDAWVYVDDQAIGAFELPAKLPILVEGKHKVFIKAGIKVNGIADTRGAYPFYDGYTTEVNFVKDSVVKINPIVNYYSVTSFPLNEDFESSGILLIKTSRSVTTIEKTNATFNVFEGEYSGIVHLTPAADLFECESMEAFKLPLSGNPIFLELNYKTEIPFSVGIFANYRDGSSKQHSIFVVNKSNNWNKIYINMAEGISNYPDAIDFNIYIGTTLPTTQNEATLLFDNIRLVHN